MKASLRRGYASPSRAHHTLPTIHKLEEILRMAQVANVFIANRAQISALVKRKATSVSCLASRSDYEFYFNRHGSLCSLQTFITG